MTLRHPDLLDPADTLLLVIDVQERFRPVMKDFDSMVAGCVRLVKTFRILDLPVIVTEQYPKGLGSTVKELQEVLGPAPPPTKTVFSSYECSGLADKTTYPQVRKVLVCGIETQVCVNQTVHDLLNANYCVHLAVDAIESRHSLDRETALHRMERAGAILTTTETAAFELLNDARHENFKKVQSLFK